MLGARVGWVTFVMVGDSLPRMGEEHGVAILPARLDRPHGEVLLDHGVRMLFFVRSIQGVDLLAEYGSPECAAGLALFGHRQTFRQDRIGQQKRAERRVVHPRLAVVFALIGSIQQACEVVGNPFASQIDAGVKPGLGVHRRNMRSLIPVVAAGEFPGFGESADFFRIPLLHHAEAAKFSLLTVEITVVIGVAGDEAIAADVVIGFHPFDHVHREWQAGDPRCSSPLVGKIKLGRWCVVNAGFSPQIVHHPDEQVGFLSAHQVHIAQRTRSFRWLRR